MADKLRIEVVTSFMDRLSGPLQRIRQGSAQTAAALKAARDQVKELEKAQANISGYRRARIELRQNTAQIGQAQAEAKRFTEQLQQQRERHMLLAANLRQAKHSYSEITTAFQDGKISGAEFTRQIELSRIGLMTSEQAYGKSKATLDQYRAKTKAATDRVQGLQQSIKGNTERMEVYRKKLEAAGISTDRLGAQARALKSKIETETAAIEKQRAALRAAAAQQARYTELKARHGKQMQHVAMMAASGAAGIATGGALARPVFTAAQAYARQEDAATQLRASMMRADGSAPAELRRISDLAAQLGNRLPGSTADFLEMMTMLRRQGMSAQVIMGGLGESAAYLGVQLKMPVTAAAEFAAKMQDATQTAEGDMMGLMDTIQRAYYLGVDPSNMLQGFKNMAAVMPFLGKKGLEASQHLAPLLVMMDQAGMSGESAGNAIRKVVQLSLDSEKLAKANKLLAPNGIALNFATGAGKFAGLENLFAQLDKLKTVESDVQRIAVMKKLFGDDAETHQVLNTLMEKGQAGYLEVLNKMKAQADLKRRVDEQLGTLSNVVEATKGVGENVLAGVGEAMAPELKQLVKWLGEVGEATGKWIKENPRLVATLGQILLVVAALFAGLGSLLLVVAGVMGPMLVGRFLFARMGMAMAGAGLKAGLLRTALVGVGKLLWGFLRRNPMAAVIVGIGTAFLELSERWEEIKAYFSAGEWGKFWGVMLEVFESTLDTITMGLYGFIKKLLGFSAIAEQPEAMRKAAAMAAVSAGVVAAVPAAASTATSLQPKPIIAIAAQQAPAREPGTLGSGTYQITINAAPGMDERALAKAVAAELDRRDRATAARRLSRLSDID